MSTRPILPKDFEELLAAFAGSSVRYLVIGGYAVGFHDRPRTTKDLDLLLDPDLSNVERTCGALRDFGAPPSVIADIASAAPDEIVWMGRPPLRIDFLKSAPGVDFSSAWSRRVIARWHDTEVSIISLDDLIAAKRAARREQDLVDVRNLERAKSTARRT